jgi:O-antigen biosynthesis protein WbqP
MKIKLIQRLIKRVFDLCLAYLLLFLFSPIFLLIAIAVKMDSSGPILYWSRRIGRGNRAFNMPKFRTMEVGTPEVATNLLDGSQYVTKIGLLLRKSSLDELPQLLSIIAGEMSFVGPRPALFNQHYLIKKREELFISQFSPGLTGWAQINGRDLISDDAKIELDYFYVTHWSLFLDFKILLLTILKVFKSENISH